MVTDMDAKISSSGESKFKITPPDYPAALDMVPKHYNSIITLLMYLELVKNFRLIQLILLVKSLLNIHQTS